MRAPNVTSNFEHLARLRRLGIAPVHCVDLGCGDGRALHELRTLFGCRISGCDDEPERLDEARELLGDTAQLSCADLWLADTSSADLVYAYLLPELMERIESEILPRMKPGAVLVSHMFPIPGERACINLGNLFVYPAYASAAPPSPAADAAL